MNWCANGYRKSQVNFKARIVLKTDSNHIERDFLFAYGSLHRHSFKSFMHAYNDETIMQFPLRKYALLMIYMRSVCVCVCYKCGNTMHYVGEYFDCRRFYSFCCTFRSYNTAFCEKLFPLKQSLHRN